MTWIKAMVGGSRFTPVQRLETRFGKPITWNKYTEGLRLRGLSMG